MSAATFGRDPFMPSPPTGRGPALALALIAHALLIAALAFGVHWRNSEPTTLAAELWSAVPQAAAPRAAEPPPTAVPVTRPQAREPEPAVRRTEPAATRPEPQIAIEQARRETAVRDKAERERSERERAARERAERAAAERERQQAREDQARKAAKADRLKAEALKVEREKVERAEKAAAVTEKADAARQETIRSANLKRLQGLAGATGAATDTGTAARSSGPSASYAGRIMARIKPNIVFGDTPDGNPMATVEVKLAPDGTIVAKRLVKSSGVKSWDEAVLRAIERTEILPRDIDGRVPPPFQIDFRLRD